MNMFVLKILLVSSLISGPAPAPGTLLDRLKSVEDSRDAALEMVAENREATAALLEELLKKFDASVHSMRDRPEQRRVRYDAEALRLGNWIAGLYTQVSGDNRPERRFAARRLRIEGTELLNQKRYREALARLAVALGEAEQLDDPWLEVITLTNMAYGHLELGQPQLALEECRRAAAEAERLDAAAQCLALFNLGAAYLHLGKFSESIALSQAAADRARELGRKIWQGNALLNLGGAYWRLGQASRARESLEQALEVLRAAGDRLGIGRSLYNLAFLSAALQDNARAAEYMEQALPIIRELDIRHSHEIDSYNSAEEAALRLLARSYESMGRLEEAQRHKKALERLLSKRAAGKEGEQGRHAH